MDQDRDAAVAIAKATLTIVLETSRTATSPEVAHDVETSLSKIPPNAILRILLPDATEMPRDCGLGNILADCGTEVVSSECTVLDNALERMDALLRHMPKLRSSVTNVGSSSGTCPRK